MALISQDISEQNAVIDSAGQDVSDVFSSARAGNRSGRVRVSSRNEGGRAVRGTSGDDDLVGSWRNDTIFGFAGWDFIAGRGGHDLLDGGIGSDVIRGGAGRDSIWGGRGKDFLTGGPGADDFWFDTRHRFDVIYDFAARDALVIDTEASAFEDVDEYDVFIRHRASFDKVFVDGDLIAKVYGSDIVDYDDVFLV